MSTRDSAIVVDAQVRHRQDPISVTGELRARTDERNGGIDEHEGLCIRVRDLGRLGRHESHERDANPAALDDAPRRRPSHARVRAALEHVGEDGRQLRVAQ